MLHNSLQYLKGLTGHVRNEFNKLKQKIKTSLIDREFIIYTIPPSLFALVGFIGSYTSPIAQESLRLSKELTGLFWGTYLGTVAGGSTDILIYGSRGYLKKL